MSIKDDYKVRAIPSEQTYEWLLKKHYAHRIPQIQYSFGLYDKDNILQGVCTFGYPCRMMMERYSPTKCYELNRLVINSNPTNIASYFISQIFKLFPEKPCIIVSYADDSQGHHGYIYQALNGIYTRLCSSERKVYLNGKLVHRRSLNALYGTSSIEILSSKYDIETEEQNGKHRYMWVLKSNKRDNIDIKYPVLPYPKGDNKRYDASYNPQVQGVLL
jgi:hypothetical protein